MTWPVKRLKVGFSPRTRLPLSSGVAGPDTGDFWRVAEKLPSKDGKYAPLPADTFDCAIRNAAWAAARSGLFRSARSIRARSGCEPNRRHQSPGMSRPFLNRCDAPPETSAAAVRAGARPGV